MRADEAAASARDAAGADPLEAPSEQKPGPELPSSQPPRRDPDEESHRSLSPAGLEDLAWAGVAVTAEAATLGVRLLGRAVEAARRATERG